MEMISTLGDGLGRRHRRRRHHKMALGRRRRRGPKGMHCVRYKHTSGGRRCAKFSRRKRRR